MRVELHPLPVAGLAIAVGLSLLAYAFLLPPAESGITCYRSWCPVVTLPRGAWIAGYHGDTTLICHPKRKKSHESARETAARICP